MTHKNPSFYNFHASLFSYYYEFVIAIISNSSSFILVKELLL